MKKRYYALVVGLLMPILNVSTVQAIDSQSIDSIEQELTKQYQQDEQDLEQRKRTLVQGAEQRLTQIKTQEEQVQDWLGQSWEDLDTDYKEHLADHTYIPMGDVPSYTKQLWDSQLKQAKSTTKGQVNIIIYLDEEGNIPKNALGDLIDLLVSVDNVYLVGKPSADTDKIAKNKGFIKQLGELTYTNDLEDLLANASHFTSILKSIKEDFDAQHADIQTTVTLPRNTITASFATYPTNPSTSQVNYWYNDPAYAGLIGRGHYGMDIVYLDSSLKDIFSVDEGIVEEVETSCSIGVRDCGGGWGNYVRVKHANGLSSLYAHLSQTHVRVGDRVQAGQVLAHMGTTGRSDGVHLHFEILDGNTKLDPTPYFDWSGYKSLN